MLRDRCLSAHKAANAPPLDADVKIVPRIIELAEEQLSVIVGTVVKNLARPPLADPGNGRGYHAPATDLGDNVAPGESFRTYCTEEDVLFLEDESGRVELKMPLCKGEDGADIGDGDGTDGGRGLGLVTGVVIAVVGDIRNGVMHVENIHFPKFCNGGGDDIDDDAAMEDEGLAEDDCILLLSGLHCGGPDEDIAGKGSSNSFRREMLLDYLTGHLSDAPNPLSNAPSRPSNIGRVLIAGGGCARSTLSDNKQPYGDWSAPSSNKNRTNASSPDTLSVQELDLFLSELCAAGVPVDYIPGAHDPTNANWPQRPVHGCLLPRAERFGDLLVRGTNPYGARIGGRVVLGSDGRNVVDLRRYMAKRVYGGEDGVVEEGKGLVAVSALEALHKSLTFHHIAPTTPDSLPSFPFEKVDPFVMERIPHVYFVGNCDKFETKLIKHGNGGGETRLICIPSFTPTGQAVLLNLKTLDCSLLEFDDVVVEDGIGNDEKMEE